MHIRSLTAAALLGTAAYLAGTAGSDPKQPTYREIAPDRKSFRLNVPVGQYQVDVVPGQGLATVTPHAGLRAGEMATLTITYTVGDTALQPDDGVLLLIPHPFSRPQHYEPIWGEPSPGQAKAIIGQQAGFTTAVASRPGTRLTFFCDPARDRSRLGEGSHLFVNVGGEPLRSGETITVTYGDTRHGSAGATSFLAQEFEIRTIVYRRMNWNAVRTALESSQQVGVWQHAASVAMIGDSPRLYVDGGGANRLLATNPSDVVAGEVFDVYVTARDPWDNLANLYRGSVGLVPQTWMQVSGGGREFDRQANGVVRLPASFAKPGTYRIDVRDEQTGLTARGNPVRVHAAEPATRLYWGDLHTHTVDSDGLGTISSAYRYARDVADLDFAAITDHLNGLTRILRDNAEEYNWPGHFVTFGAFERSGILEGGGDVIIYFKENRPEYENVLPGGLDIRIRVNIQQLAENLQRVNKDDILVIPHNHNGASYTRNPAFRHSIYRLVEIYSVWGNGERMDPLLRPYFFNNPPRVVQEALGMGCRMGIIASGDGHSGRPGYDNWLRVRRSHISGLVAAPTPALTKEAVWDALWTRHVYGTTGKRMLLDVTLNGRPMGQTIKAAGPSMPRDMEIAVEGTDLLREVVIVKNNQDIRRFQGQGMSARLRFRDDTPITGTDYYYVRVVQEPDDLAWSSPIWVEYP